MSVTLHQHHPWMCPAGRMRTAIIHVLLPSVSWTHLLPSVSWTAPLISPNMFLNIDCQDSRFHSIAHLMCYRYAVAAGQKTFATGIRKWSKHLTDFPTPKFETIDWIQRWRMILMDIYSHLCLTGESVRADLIATGPFKLHCVTPWGYVRSGPDTSTLHHTAARADLISDILIDVRIRATSDKLTPCTWLTPRQGRGMRPVHWLQGSRLRNKDCDAWWDYHLLSPLPFRLEFRIACNR